ncbi:MAG TPA: hypothetical protein PK514_05355 [Spirochaetota bacterium]|nr:hypothetical protein [Spirochaetota bacterium]
MVLKKIISIISIILSILTIACQADDAATTGVESDLHETTDPAISNSTGTTQSFENAVSLDDDFMTDDERSSAGKGATTLVKKLPDAENAFFTRSGRLFITGGNAVYEITGEDSSVRIFYDSTGIFGGMAQSGKWLYVVYATMKDSMSAVDLNSFIATGDFSSLTDIFLKKTVIRADLSLAAEDMVFEEVCVLGDVFLPNGMAADSDGNIYITDGPFLPKGQIIRLVITDPVKPVVKQEPWLTYKDGAYSPNGIVIRDNVVYFTDFVMASAKSAQVKKVPIVNGRPGTVETIYSAAGLFDDLDAGIYRNTPVLVVADYAGNSIILVSPSGGTGMKIYSSMLSSPSSVHFGTGVLFDTNELIITEKGLLYDYYSTLGNRVDLMTLPE